jgi:hypothetical protein
MLMILFHKIVVSKGAYSMSIKSVFIAATAITAVSLFVQCGISLKVQPLDAPASSLNKDAELNPDEYWESVRETVSSPGVVGSDIKPVHEWSIGKLPEKGFTYVYGGRTAYRVQPGTSQASPGILVCYLDNREYSGVTIARGSGGSVDLAALRKARAAGIAFWAKTGAGIKAVYIGMLDDESDGKKVQSRVSIGDFGKLDTVWRYFMIPLKRFQSKGTYWDDNKKMEITDDVNWKKINEIRFSINKGENRVSGQTPVKLYVDRLSVIQDIPGYVDPEAFWNAFSSNEPDLLIDDFESASSHSWSTGTGPASQAKCEVVQMSHPGCGAKALAVTYQLNDWCDVMYNLSSGNQADPKRNWARHWGIKLTVFTEKAYQAFNVQVSDAGNELYIASSGAANGWNEVIVPFKDFSKFPYYQPPDAVSNGTFDLDNVIMIDIKPAGEGTGGTFLVDNVALTNSRSVETAAVPSERKVVLKGDFGLGRTKRISEGVFGINAAHWDGDLLLPKTAELVKNVGHPIIRFPGGLSADDYHWEKVLAAKDHNVDIDEFLAFCKKTQSRPMFTVNFGTGTPEEAASWVHYVNVVKKEGVRYWEIGNELYGDWHKNHCSAEEYGKRAAQFIKAMKQVDSTIFITVVWQIESPWNKIVFDYTKDIADGVNVHNYPQQSGQENDRALLAAPQALEGIIGRVRNQLKAYGTPDKPYQIWLTEWNSVDNEPGPQSIGIANALFVADYLAVLSKVDIETATYWNIHNYVFGRGGDYGYLSRSDVPEGPNVTRPSYWAFKMTRESLRGSLAACSSNDVGVSAYASVHPDGAKSILIINKYPKTEVLATLDFTGFKGEAVELRLDNNSGVKGYSTEKIKLEAHAPMVVPPYSIIVLTVK